MTNDNDWTRLARYFAGECTAAEAEEIRRWLDADSNRQLAAELQSAWDVAATPTTTWDTPASWERLAARLRARERRAALALVQPAARSRSRRGMRWWAAAAAAVAIVSGGVLWRTSQRHSTPAITASALREIRTAATQRTAFRLADGSRVMLAPGSVLRYDPARFGASRRELHLEGRAYFEVTHDARRPFVVHTGRTVTEDLGTEFVITDYPRDARAEVAVASGSVAVRRAAVDGVGRPVVLVEGELVQLDSAGRKTVRRGLDLASRLAWTEGRLVFVETPVVEVLAELNRWYGLDVRLGDASLAAHRFTATYTTQPDSVVLRELTAATSARAERRGAVVTLYPTRARP